MDPNITLSEIRELLDKIVKDYETPDGNGVDQDDAYELADKIGNLDKWIVDGGFHPDSWAR